MSGDKIPGCRNCGDELRFVDQYDSWYCHNCREYRDPEVRPHSHENYPPNVRNDYSIQPPRPKAKSNKIKIIATIIVIFIILDVVMFYIFYLKDTDSDSSQSVSPGDFSDDLPGEVTLLEIHKLTEKEIYDRFGGNETYLPYIFELYDINLSVTSFFETETSFDYEDISNFEIEFSIWKGTEEVNEEFHGSGNETEYTDIESDRGYLEKNFQLDPTVFEYSVYYIEDYYNQGQVNIRICYIHENYQVHTLSNFIITDFDTDNILELNSVINQILETFPGWDEQAENEINDFVSDNI